MTLLSLSLTLRARDQHIQPHARAKSALQQLTCHDEIRAANARLQQHLKKTVWIHFLSLMAFISFNCIEKKSKKKDV